MHTVIEYVLVLRLLHNYKQLEVCCNSRHPGFLFKNYYIIIRVVKPSWGQNNAMCKQSIRVR